MNETYASQLGDTLRLHYKLSSPDGTTFEDTFEGDPVEITLGQSELAHNLERCLIGLPCHERHVFLLEPEQAFGRSDERLVQRIPLADFPAELAPRPNMMMEFQLPNGTSLPGVIQEIGQSDAVVDFNHPLADCPVEFEVEVLEITPGAAIPRPDSH